MPVRWALQAAWRASTHTLAQDQTQIETGDMHQHPFEDVGVSSQVRSTHPARVVYNAQNFVRSTRHVSSSAAYHATRESVFDSHTPHRALHICPTIYDGYGSLIYVRTPG